MTQSAVAGGVALAVAGAGWALWPSDGEVAGAAPALVTLDGSLADAVPLYPGATGTLVVAVHNPNPHAVRLAGVGAGSGTVGVVRDTAAGDCSTSGVEVVTVGGLELTAPPGVSTHAVPDGVRMDPASDDGCQHARFHVPVTVTGDAGGLTAVGGAVAGELPRMPAPSTAIQGAGVLLTWPASASKVDGYRVAKYDANGVPVPIAGACGVLVTGTSCVDTELVDGSWTYTLWSARGDHWAGEASEPVGPGWLGTPAPAPALPLEPDRMGATPRRTSSTVERTRVGGAIGGVVGVPVPAQPVPVPSEPQPEPSAPAPQPDPSSPAPDPTGPGESDPGDEPGATDPGQVEPSQSADPAALWPWRDWGRRARWRR